MSEAISKDYGMNKFTIALLVRTVSWASLFLIAMAPSMSNGASLNIEGKYVVPSKCDGSVVSFCDQQTLQIKRLSSTLYKFSIWVSNSRGHSCDLEGEFRLKNKLLQYEKQECKLQISIRQSGLMLKDSQSCIEEAACGASIFLDNLYFPYESRVNNGRQ